MLDSRNKTPATLPPAAGPVQRIQSHNPLSMHKKRAQIAPTMPAQGGIFLTMRHRLVEAVAEELHEGAIQHAEERMIKEECNGLPPAAIEYIVVVVAALDVAQRHN